jgi:hypothetical protein
LGDGAGDSAASANNSNFLGYNAGYYATNASYSNLFGYRVGSTFSGNNIGSNNIIIGTNISLGNAVSNSMNIGGVLFGTGFQNATSGNPIITAVNGGKIGIGVVSPAYTLDVGNSGVSGIVAQFTNSTGYCSINPTNTALSCTSDINLKKNITNISDNTPFTLSTVNITNEDTILSKISKLNPVFYNWNTEDDTVSKHSGFIAQEVEQIFPDLVATNPDTNLKSVNYTGLSTYLVGAVKYINDNAIFAKNIKSIESLSGNWRIAEDGTIYANKLCLKNSQGKNVCINGDQLQSIGGIVEYDTNTPQDTGATSTTTSTSTDTQIENPPAIDQSSISQIVDEVINNIQDNSSINNTDNTTDTSTSNPIE